MPKTDVVSRLNDTDSLLDVMIQIEDYIDSLDLYAFANWFDGEIVDGPWVKRYWVKTILKFPYNKMPDPQGGLRLAKYGSKVEFEKSTEEQPVEVLSPDDLDPETKAPKMKEVPVWLVHLKIPRRFINELDVDDLELYDKDLDVEAAEEGAAEGIDNESGVREDEPEDMAPEGEAPEGGEDELEL